MKKRMVAAMLALAMTVSLSACSGNQEEGTGNAGADTGGNAQGDAAAAGDLVINFYEHSDAQAFVDAQVEAFNALDNGITVVPHVIANDSYDDKIKVLASGSGEDLDVFWLRGSSVVKQYMDNNALADLSGFAAASGLDLSPIRDTTLALVTDESGAFYGLPTTGSAWMLFYNRDLFDAKGLPYPENLTWDEYAELAKELTYEEDGTQYWGGLLPDWTMNLGATAAGEYLTADEPMPYTRKYMEVLHRLYAEDRSHPGIATITSGSYDYNAVFESGNVYMMINGDWDFNLLSEDLNYGTAPLPVFEDIPAESTVGQASYFCISAASQNQEAAYEFIEFCTASEAGGAIYAAEKNIPSYPSDQALEIYQKEVTVPGVEYRFSAKINSEVGTESYYNDLNEAFKQEMQLYLLDEQTLEKAFANYDKLRAEKMAG
ncbi:MAG: extracellular solute-binding protein [Clostridium sp.]|jgi:ABC-type glycerol-3-phosphate transport system substrate-binding protein|nr:extracellular solute-binding protein [Clostridium sp.]